jgi:DNA ligase D-like protein (predicted 3'-phosphoesterase)
MNTGSLKTYREKRNFRRTPEPDERSKKKDRKKPIFTVQKHAARQLHFDFRLQVGRKLKSWAVPKGPSVDPKDKRMAVEVEDHPLAYANFEGVIPDGEYGAGTVMVWDTGTFRNISKRNHKEVTISRALESGHVAVWLQGKRLRGGYALRRIAAGKKPRWLLIKMRDEEADFRRNLAKIETKSALSGRTMQQIREATAEESQTALLN